MKIHIHIDRLVLEGLPVDRHSAPLIQEAVQTELSRLFVDSGASSSLLSSSGAIPSLRTAPIQVAAQSQPDAVGYEVANAVHGRLQ
jgi:hypothetical protein